MQVSLAQIHLFPLKSAAGIAVAEWEVGPRGLALDRHWMVVNPEGRFLSQREIPRMALIRTRLEEGRLVLSAAGMPELAVDPRRAAAERIPVQVWRDGVAAAPVGPDADRWLGSFLERPCRLVQFAAEVLRQVDPTRARRGDQVGFADGFPFLLASDSSLAALNERLATPVTMRRFRPNLVVSGAAPFAEDEWRRLRIGAIELEIVKPCARCAIVTVDPETAAVGKEPLATLARFRRREGEVFFGQNLVHRGEGLLRVGDPVTVLA